MILGGGIKVGVDVISRNISDCTISFDNVCDSCGGEMRVTDFYHLLIDDKNVTKRAEVQCSKCDKYKYYYE